MVMVGNLPFPRDWARAAEYHVRVSYLGATTSTTTDRWGGNRPHQLRPSRLFYPLNDRLAARRLLQQHAQIVSDHGPIDLVHGHFFSAARPLPLVARALRIPLIVTEHATAMTGHAAPHKQINEPAVGRARRLYDQADVVVAVSHYMAERIRAQTGASPTVIGNPVDTELFALGAPPTDGPFRFVFVGRLEADKRPELLVHAVAKARQEIPLHVTIVGDGPDRSRVQSLVDDLGLEGAVLITGRMTREGVADVVRAAHVGVSTSLVETFGVAVAEFAASGLPVVAPHQPPFDEVLPESGRLLLAAPSVDALADALTRAATTSWDRRSIRQHIVDRYSYRCVGSQLSDLYRKVLSNR